MAEDSVNRLLAGDLSGSLLRVPEYLEKEHNKVILKENVTYIVNVVMVNPEKSEVLLIQEAKRSRRGTWYLPAGRLEQGETLVEGAKREFEEETGLCCEPTTLVSVEMQRGCWMRFSFTGVITGGHLKTLAEADGESLQASWFPICDVKLHKIPLRSMDIIPLIEIVWHYMTCPVVNRHPSLLPNTTTPYRSSLIRIVLLTYNKLKESVNIVISSQEDGDRLPVINVFHQDQKCVIDRFVEEVLGMHLEIKHPSLLAVEHTGFGGNHGVCLTVLGIVRTDAFPKLDVHYAYKLQQIESSPALLEKLHTANDAGKNIVFKIL